MSNMTATDADLELRLDEVLESMTDPHESYSVIGATIREWKNEGGKKVPRHRSFENQLLINFPSADHKEFYTSVLGGDQPRRFLESVVNTTNNDLRRALAADALFLASRETDPSLTYTMAEAAFSAYEAVLAGRDSDDFRHHVRYISRMAEISAAMSNNQNAERTVHLLSQLIQDATDNGAYYVIPPVSPILRLLHRSHGIAAVDLALIQEFGDLFSACIKLNQDALNCSIGPLRAVAMDIDTMISHEIDKPSIEHVTATARLAATVAENNWARGGARAWTATVLGEEAVAFLLDVKSLEGYSGDLDAALEETKENVAHWVANRPEDALNWHRIASPEVITLKDIEPLIRPIAESANPLVAMVHLGEQIRRPRTESEDFFVAVDQWLLRDDRFLGAGADSFDLDIQFQFQQFLLRSTISRLRTEGAWTEEALISWFDEMAFLSSDDHELLNHGLSRYFEGEHIDAMHVLMPRFESGLRSALKARGVNTVTRQSGSLYRETTLGGLLEKSQTTLGDFAHDLCNFALVEEEQPASPNLRNELSHGFLKVAACTEENVGLLIFLVMQLARFKDP